MTDRTAHYQIHPNREAWLHAAMDAALRPYLQSVGIDVPPVRIGVGYGRGGERGSALSETKPRSHSHDNVNEITIRIAVTNPIQVLTVLLREAIHASQDTGLPGMKSRVHLEDKAFHDKCKAVGILLDSSRAITHDLEVNLTTLAVSLGDYPAAAVAEDLGYSKQTTRMLAYVCPVCGMAFRTSKKHAWKVERCTRNNCVGIPMKQVKPLQTANP